MTESAVKKELPAEVEYPEGFGTDTCDRCGHKAWIWAYDPDTRRPLTYCGHHGREYMPGLAVDGFRVVDMTHLILEFG